VDELETLPQALENATAHQFLHGVGSLPVPDLCSLLEEREFKLPPDDRGERD
jgi:hypothetical protein